MIRPYKLDRQIKGCFVKFSFEVDDVMLPHLIKEAREGSSRFTPEPNLMYIQEDLLIGELIIRSDRDTTAEIRICNEDFGGFFDDVRRLNSTNTGGFKSDYGLTPGPCIEGTKKSSNLKLSNGECEIDLIDFSEFIELIDSFEIELCEHTKAEMEKLKDFEL